MAQSKLTKKQETFVETYLETGNGTQSALEAYDTKDPDVAKVIASENLTKPNVVEAIRRGQKDSQIEEAFDKLINLKRLDYFVFPKTMADEEIKAHVEAQGITVLNVRPTEKGKMAFFAIPDGQALARALDIWAKIAGANAPDKHVNINIKAEPSERIKELAKKLNT